MDLQIQAEEADTSTYVLNGEWALLGMFEGKLFAIPSIEYKCNSSNFKSHNTF